MPIGTAGSCRATLLPSAVAATLGIHSGFSLRAPVNFYHYRSDSCRLL